MAYKGFNLLTSATLAPWGDLEHQNWVDIVDYVGADTINVSATSAGHKHNSLYNLSADEIIYVSGENVGIGTGSPSSSLHVVGEFSSTDSIEPLLTVDRLTTGEAVSGIGGSIVFRTEDGYSDVREAGSVFGYGIGLDADVFGVGLGIYAFNTHYERLLIDINTTTIRGTGDDSHELVIDANSSSFTEDVGMTLKHDSIDRWRVYYDASQDLTKITATTSFDDGTHIQIDEIRARDGDGLYLVDDDGNGILIEDGGNVGIGINNISATLDVFCSSGDACKLSTGAENDSGTILVLNQQGGCDSCYTLDMRHGLVSHGVTDIAPTDTYFRSSILSTNQGGTVINSISEDSAQALLIRAVMGNGCASIPVMEFSVAEKDGATTGITTVADTIEAFEFTNNTTRVAVIRGNGDFEIAGSLTITERSSDPFAPSEGECIIWMSDGSGKGSDGDVMIASTAGGVTKYDTLFSHAGGSSW